MPKTLNIISIILPLLIIVLGLIRYYSDGKRNFGGTIIFIAFLLLLIGLFRYFIIGSGGRGGSGSSDSGNKQSSVSVSKHSEAFNNSMESVLNTYYEMTEGFVNWDTAAINNSGNKLKAALDSLKIDELQKDSIIYLTVLDYYNNAKAEAASIIADPSMEEKRGSLNILSDQLKTIWTTVKYDRQKAYWQECPMAFGDDKSGNWLSKTKEVRNPYLGTKHPEYGDKMLNCGGPKETIKFYLPVDTTKKQ